jgi:hypothetical protein
MSKFASCKIAVGKNSRVGNVGHNSLGGLGVPVHSLPAGERLVVAASHGQTIKNATANGMH